MHEKILEKERFREERDRLRLRDLEQSRQLEARLKSEQRLVTGGSEYQKDGKTGIWLKKGETAEQEKAARLGASGAAIDRVAAAAQQLQPYYDAVVKAMTVTFAAWGAGITAGPGAVGDALLTAKDFVDSLRDTEVVTSKDATRTDNELHTVERLQVAVRGTVKPKAMDRLVKAIAEDYARQLSAAERSVPPGAQHREKVVGRVAEQMVRKVDLPKRLKQFGIPARNVIVEPWTGATGPGGGQTRYDLGIEGRRRWAMIELKSSGYSVARSEWQLQTHFIGVGEGTATYGKRGDYYRVLGAERKILKWTYEDLNQYLHPSASRGRSRVRGR